MGGVVFLGLDACDSGLVDEYIRAGELPNLADLFATAAISATSAPPGLFVSTTWPTLFTATSVVDHDYVCWIELDPGTYDYRQTTPAEIERPTLWEHVTRAGGRVLALDIPHMTCHEESDAVLVAEYGCHDRHYGPRSTPAALLEDLERDIGSHPVGCAEPREPGHAAPCDRLHRDGPHRTPTENQALLDDLLEGSRLKRRVIHRLLDDGPWDLFMAALGEGHCTGHQLWHVHDASHPAHDAPSRALLGDPLLRVYQEFDRTVGEVRDRLPTDTTLFVLLSHGMQAHYDGCELLDPVLFRIEQAEYGAAKRGWRSRLGAMADPLPIELKRRLLGATAPALRRRVASAPPGRPTDLDGIHGASRRWFRVPNNTVDGAIRLNLVGREPHGLVEPGAEADETCRLLEQRLLELVNIDTGEPAVSRVTRADDVYERRELDALPDIFVEWNRSAPVDRVWSPAVGVVIGPYEHWRTGDHNHRGTLITHGLSVAPGKRHRTLGMDDVGATIAAATGTPVGEVTGRPDQSLLAPPVGVQQ